MTFTYVFSKIILIFKNFALIENFNIINMIIKTHDSESRGQEEAAVRDE